MKTTLNVVIADDSPLVRERLAMLLSELDGIELVGQAGTGDETLQAVERLKPDVLILDLHMPGNNGMEVLEAIKRGGAGPVVIVLTAFPYPQYRERCLKAGAEYFFDKASEFEEVSEALQQLRDTRGGLR
mgnify:CR=1 FL=1